jgi:hypothetical protein
MNKTIIFLLLIIHWNSNGQNITLLRNSSICEDLITPEGKQLQERIISIESEPVNSIKFTLLDDCGLEFYPYLRMKNDTLEIEMIEINQKILILKNKDTIITHLGPEECNCMYSHTIEFLGDTIMNIKVNEKNLRISEEPYITVKPVYFIYQNDTTGFIDKYGLRQGAFYFERKNNIMKRYYTNNKLTQIDIIDYSGNLVSSEKYLSEPINSLK